ncbi:MAG: aminomethyltransferase family protein [Pseudomonadota bacterium]
MNIAPDHFVQPLNRSPFINRFEALSRTENWATWNSYKVARVVDEIANEYFAVRSACAVMDLTPMEKYRISGPDARAFLDRLVVRDLSKLRTGRVTYVAWCNDEGHVIDDGTLFQLGENDYRLCSQHHQLDWLHISAQGFDVAIEHETHQVAALAVQGPTSFSVLRDAGAAELDELKPFGFVKSRIAGQPVLISRTGYTGDLGYELWLDPAAADAVWDAVFAQTPHYAVSAMGLDALEMVRLEAGFVMPGFDFVAADVAIRSNRARTPTEAGLGWLVSFDKGHFTGRAALLAEKSETPRRRLVKLTVEGNRPVCDSFIHARRGGPRVGEIRAATWSPMLKTNVALAEINLVRGDLPANLWARVDYQRELAWHSIWARCHPQIKAAVTPAHRSLTPPQRY